MATRKPPRLTDSMSVALAKASAAATVGAKGTPEQMRQAFAMIEVALAEVHEHMGAIRRAAEQI